MDKRLRLPALAAFASAALLSGASFSEPNQDFARAALSPRLEGAGSTYGSYDVFKAFANPALLANQARRWEVATSDSVMFGGGQNMFNVAGGWGGQKNDVGTFGAALLFSMVSSEAFDELDAMGNHTGTTIASSIMQFGAAGLYQWEFIAFGVQARMAPHSYGAELKTNEDHGYSEAIGTDAFSFKMGTTVSLGKLEMGAVYTMYPADIAGIGFGLAFVSKGFFDGSVGLDFDMPFAQEADSGVEAPKEAVLSKPTNVGGGVTWNAHKWVTLRAGFVGSSVGGSVRFGFTVPYRDWTLDYAGRLPLMSAEAGMGMTNMFGLGWSFGAERKKAEGPKFFMKQEERTLAVSNFDPQNVPAGDAAVISDLLRNQLIKEGAFNIVEKANMDKILGEQAFQQTGCTSQECAVKLGKILNVKFLVVGSFGKVMESYMLSMRVIDVETAKAIYSDEAEGRNLSEIREGIKVVAKRLTEAVQKQK